MIFISMTKKSVTVSVFGFSKFLSCLPSEPKYTAACNSIAVNVWCHVTLMYNILFYSHFTDEKVIKRPAKDLVKFFKTSVVTGNGLEIKCEIDRRSLPNIRSPQWKRNGRLISDLVDDDIQVLVHTHIQTAPPPLVCVTTLFRHVIMINWSNIRKLDNECMNWMYDWMNELLNKLMNDWMN